MAETTTVVLQSAASSTPTLVDVPVNATSPPIVYFFRLALSIVSTAYSAAILLIAPSWSLLKTVFSTTRSALSAFSTPLLYILAPVIVLGQILLYVLVRAPLSLVTGIAVEVYPLYVFVGAAFIWAAFVGFCARNVTLQIQLIIFGSENLVSTRDVAARKKAEASSAKTPKKVSIKEGADVKPIMR